MNIHSNSIIVVRRAHVILVCQTAPLLVHLTNNTPIIRINQSLKPAIPIIHTADPNINLIHQPRNVKLAPALVDIIIQQNVHQHLAHAQATTVTVPPPQDAYHTATLTDTIHTVSKPRCHLILIKTKMA